MEDLPAFQLGDGDVLNRVPSNLIRPSKVKSRPQPWQNATLPSLEPLPADTQDAARAIGKRLRDNAVPHPEGNRVRFWPPKLFDHLFDRIAVYQVIDALVNANKLQAIEGNTHKSPEEAKIFWTDRICGKPPQGTSFRRLLALLILVRKEDCIGTFLERNIPDKSIPLDDNDPIFRDWEELESDGYFKDQRGFKVAFFASSTKCNDACNVVLDSQDIEPWYTISDRPERSSSAQNTGSVTSTSKQMQAMTLGGSYGDVYKIVIHPWQHDFNETLEFSSVHENFFALKRLHSANKKAFEKETDMLKRFSGHPNIVTLLATITRRKGLGNEQYHLLFPWADGDLLSYWENKRKPRRNLETFMWLSDQAHGIVNAINFIHNPSPKISNSKGEQLSGRHGDIKPENVLWFRKDGAEILVIADLGLSTVHRDTSRSNVPGAGIPVTPNYRPPECDMDGPFGKISRSFDIWTLGCLFLEFTVWILEGWAGRQSFRSDRWSTYINGLPADIYFDVMKIDGEPDQHAFKIKDQVAEASIARFKILHNHPDCTEYLHDLLDLIETHMMVVESDNPEFIERIRSPELVQKIGHLKDKCKDTQYLLARCPRESTRKPRLPVRAPLSQTAKELLVHNHMDTRLPSYQGETRSANSRRNSS